MRTPVEEDTVVLAKGFEYAFELNEAIQIIHIEEVTIAQSQLAPSITHFASTIQFSSG